MAQETIGFVGVGLMGQGMAKNIVEKGFPLTVMAHRNRAPIDDLVRRGASEAKSLREIAEKSSIVFLCVTGSREVEAVIRGKDGLKAGLKPGSIVIDCSTADPTSTVALAEELAAAGIGYADAPLGGTPVQAAEGKLSAMVGATDEVFARIEPVIQTWAVNNTEPRYRHAALTWFVMSYFVGIFGFPAVGGWVLVHLGREIFLSILLAAALAELAIAASIGLRRVQAA